MSVNKYVQIKWRNSYGTHRKTCRNSKAVKLADEFKLKGWFYEIDKFPFG